MGSPIGMVLDGRYRILGELGRGGMATVYLARQEALDRDVVVKIPEAHLLQDEEFRTRFSREIRSMVSLPHPNIVEVLDAGAFEGQPYAVLKYLDGGNLKDRMPEAAGRDRRADPAAVLPWLVPIAEALDFVHANGVVHRDVKPANILFDRRGKPVLSDFGVAKVMGLRDTKLTMTDTTPGTPAYMAPECARGGPLEGASDQYSLAAIVYEFLTGHLPIEGNCSLECMVKKQSETPVHLCDRVPGLPRRAGDAVMRSLSVESGARYPDCRSFAEDFAGAFSPPESAMADESGPTRPWPVEPPEPGPRRSVMLALAVVVVLAVAAALLLAFRGRSPPPIEDGAAVGPVGPGPEPAAGDLHYAGDTTTRFLAMIAAGRGFRAGDPARNPAGLLTAVHERTGLVFLLIPSGVGTRGSAAGRPDELPVSTVRIASFLLGETECTQAAFEKGGGKVDSGRTGPELPVDHTSWHEVVGWCRDNGLRLPSEAEWEYACRAGSRGEYDFPGAPGSLGEYAWTRENSDGRPHPARQKKPNAFGLFDVHGNVFEWCEDLYDASYAGAPVDGRARRESTYTGRVARGGSFADLPEHCRAAARSHGESAFRGVSLGFRPAADLE